MRKAAMVVLLLGMTALATAQTKSITTTFTSNNGGSTDWTNMFDLKVAIPTGITVTQLDLNISSAANTAFTIDVYTTPTTYVGKDGNPGAWTKVSSGAGVSQGRDNPTTVDVTDFKLPAGSYGFAIHYTGASMAYTNGTGNNQSYTNCELTLQLGLVRAGLFTGSTFQPRVWNGSIYYSGGFACVASANLSVGTSGSVALTGGPATDTFQIAASTGNSTKLDFGNCSVFLDPDGVLIYSVLFGAPYFNNYFGTLAGGAGKGTFSPPALPVLVGVDIYHAGIAIGTGGVTGATNTVKTQLTR